MSKQLFRKPNREDWDDISKLGFRNSGNKIIGVYVDPVFEGARKACVTVVRVASNGSYITTQHHIDGTFQESAISDWDVWVVDEEEPEQIKHKPLTREDWNDISKLTFRDAEGHEIVEVKILESFIGVKPYPVVVIMRTLTNDLIARQYTIEGKAEKMVDDFQIIKIEIIKIEEPELPIDYEGIIKDLAVTRAFITYDGEYYAPILWVNVNSKRFCTGALHWEFDKIRGFDITFDMNTFYAFNEYLQLRKENRVPTVDEFGNIWISVKS